MLFWSCFISIRKLFSITKKVIKTPIKLVKQGTYFTSHHKEMEKIKQWKEMYILTKQHTHTNPEFAIRQVHALYIYIYIYMSVPSVLNFLYIIVAFFFTVGRKIKVSKLWIKIPLVKSVNKL